MRFQSHDSTDQLLCRISADAASSGEESYQFVDLDKGVLVIDDSTLDKGYELSKCGTTESSSLGWIKRSVSTKNVLAKNGGFALLNLPYIIFFALLRLGNGSNSIRK